jgi:hypothetical protein
MDTSSKIMSPASDALPRRIALVHEWFTPRSTGGAELVVEALDRLLTDLERQPTLAALVDGESKRRGSWLSGRSIRTSAIQNLPWGVSHVQQYLPLLPMAIEQIDLGDADLVISSSHLVGKGVLTVARPTPYQLCAHASALRLGSDALPTSIVQPWLDGG